MTFAKQIVRGLAVGAIAVGLTTAASAQNGTNFHVLSNGLDAVYLNIGGGSGQTGGADGIGNWIDGNDLRGNYITALGEFGYRQSTFFTSECVLGAPPAVALDFPGILFIEFDGRNPNDQDIFTRPACTAGLPNGTTTAGFLPYGISPGASAQFFLAGLPTGAGLPSTAAILLPNNGLAPASNGGTATLIAAAGAALPISSTGFCWIVMFTWTPSALVGLDNIDGWWHWNINSVNNNQYWGLSNDELNVYSSNTVALSGNQTALNTFFASFEYEWHGTTADPSMNNALNPAGINGTGPYYAADNGALNPNGGWDLGRHGGASISGTGGTINPITGNGTQNPAGTPSGGIPTYGYMSWNNEVSGLRTVWHQVDWAGTFGVDPDTLGAGYNALVGPPGQRLPVGVSSLVNPAPGWPQGVSIAQFPLMFHTPTSGHPETDPLGFPAGSFGIVGQWGATNMLPINGLSEVCTIGLPVAVQYGSVAVKSDLSDFEFNPAVDKISASGNIMIID
ncbi:MAG: hypothetical protein P8N09_01140 [Planctomycetota bacterium]|nr:hypothetical protein [Planctomycetota bacterium]